MAVSSLHTADMHGLVERWRQGDREACGQLIQRVGDRLGRLTRGMLRRFPAVQRQADSEDVLQGALMRLVRALKAAEPASMREFYGLAAEQIRRELLDLARHFKRRVQIREQDMPALNGQARAVLDVVDADEGESDLDRWCSLHEAVERLPAAEREVFSLTHYHGWTQQQIAELLLVTDRQVRRRWNAALLALGRELAGRLPDLRED